MDLVTAPGYEDALIRTIGEYGRFQVGLSFLTGLTVLIHAWQMLVNKFLTYPVPHFCKRPDQLQDSVSLEQWLNLSAPVLEDGSLDRCRRFAIDYWDGWVRPENTSGLETVECTEFEYDETLFQDTATKRFDLVCSRRHLKRVGQLVFFTGTLVGVLASGFLSDIYGRMMTYIFWLALWSCAGLLEAFASSFWLWAALRFLVGGASIAYNTVQTVYLIEISGQKWRSVTNNYFRALPFTLGYLSLALMVYLIPNMATLEIFIAASGLPFLVVLFFLPESPRWLLVNGRMQQGLQVVKKACKVNERQYGQGERKLLETWAAEYHDGGKGANENGNLRLLLKYPASLRNLVLISFCWMSLSMAYFGLIYNTPTFGFDVRIVYVIPGFAFGWLVFAMPYLENTFGRKVMLVFSFALTGVPLLLTMAVPADAFWSIIVLAYLGQAGCSMAFDVAYSFTRELFPTSMRSTTMGVGSGAARVGAMLSPIIALAEDLNVLLPIVIYGSFAFAALVLSVWVWPETSRLNLPNSMGEAEAVARTNNTWLFWKRSNKVGGEGEDGHRRRNNVNGVDM